MSDTNDIASTISSIVKSSPDQKILGSVLQVGVKQQHPDFDPSSFGCNNLRQFIHQHVPDLFESARSGGDIVYSLRSAVPREQTHNIPKIPEEGVPVIERSVWKTFVSPSETFRLFVNPITKQFQVLSSYEPTPTESWVQIRSCPPDTHLVIAKDFSETIANEAARSELKQILKRNFWWPEFNNVARRFGYDHQWATFRRYRLWLEFKKVLESIGVDTSIIAGSTMTFAPASRSKTRSEVAIRRVAVGVIRKLPTSQLRKLRLPLGYVLDELDRN